MDKIFNNTKFFFLGLFALALAAILAYQLFYVMPEKRCEAAGRWWTDEYRACGLPVKISTLTGQPDPVKVPAAPAKPVAAPVPAAPVPAAKAP